MTLTFIFLKISCILCLVVWLEYFLLREYNLHKILHRDLYEDPFIEYDGSSPTFPLPYRIVITGLARNISKRIRTNLKLSRLLGSYFEKYKIIIFENDSEDDTRNVIKRAMKFDPNIRLIESNIYPDCKLRFPNLYSYGVISRQRIAKMAFYRNVCNHFIFKYYTNYDFVIVMDMDMEGNIPILKILESIRVLDKSSTWSAISANGRSPIPGSLGNLDTMYDAMAFCENDQDMAESEYRNHTSFKSIIAKYIRMMRLSMVGKRYCLVKSAFNGLCIYKLEDIKNCNYTDEHVCEHISLHKQFSKLNKSMAIDLSLKIQAGHQGPKKWVDFF